MVSSVCVYVGVGVLYTSCVQEHIPAAFAFDVAKQPRMLWAITFLWEYYNLAV